MIKNYQYNQSNQNTMFDMMTIIGIINSISIKLCCYVELMLQNKEITLETANAIKNLNTHLYEF